MKSLNKTSALLFLSFLLLSTFLLPAKSTETTSNIPKVAEEPIDTAKRITFFSEILDENVSFNIALPDNFDVASEQHKYPVIVAAGSHGGQFFHTLTGITNHLGKLERMPESIVVTMETAATEKVLTNGMWGREALGPFGDTEAVTRHLKEEFFPFLAQHYRAAEYRIIIGVSGSTLFPIHTYLNHPGLFDAHLLLASADMIGMSYEGEPAFVERFYQLRKSQPEIPTQLYIGVSTWDINGPNDKDVRDVLDIYKKKVMATADDTHKFVLDVIPRVRHYEMYMQGIIAGLDMVFPFEEWSAKYRDIIKQPGRPLANLENHFKTLGDSYGIPLFPKADRWNSINALGILAKRQWQANNNDEAKELIDKAVQYYPKSNYLKELQAEFYTHMEQWQSAIDAYHVAYDLAQTREPEMLSQYKTKISDLEQKLK